MLDHHMIVITKETRIHAPGHSIICAYKTQLMTNVPMDISTQENMKNKKRNSEI